MVPVHTHMAYEDELRELRNRLSLMGEQVRAMLRQSLSALMAGDRDLALATIALDHGVNLRFIATAHKLVTGLERIGDLCVNICERIAELERPADPEIVRRLADMGDRVGRMIDEALEAFLTGHVVLAERVLEEDGPVDQCYIEIFERLLERMHRDEAQVHEAVRLQSIAKHLERMGDHATNLAEMVIFMVEGRDVRHPGRLAS